MAKVSNRNPQFYLIKGRVTARHLVLVKKQHLVKDTVILKLWLLAALLRGTLKVQFNIYVV